MNSSVSIKVVTSTFLKGKQTSKISIFEVITLKQRRRSKTKKKLYFCLDFGMLMSCATTDFLEVSARVSSNVVTNGSLRGKRISKINIFILLF